MRKIYKCQCFTGAASLEQLLQVVIYRAKTFLLLSILKIQNAFTVTHYKLWKYKNKNSTFKLRYPSTVFKSHLLLLLLF